MARRRGNIGSGFGWLAFGFGTGLLTGYLVGEMMIGARIRVRGSAGAEAAARRRATLAAVTAALDADPELRELGLTALAVRPGEVELHGWVPSRAVRTRATRLVRQAAGGQRVVNHLLVRGEDDRDLPDSFDADPTDQTA
ncbi:MAG: BON domain-containing protein [Gemmatimonadota bacterium]